MAMTTREAPARASCSLVAEAMPNRDNHPNADWLRPCQASSCTALLSPGLCPCPVSRRGSADTSACPETLPISSQHARALDASQSPTARLLGRLRCQTQSIAIRWRRSGRLIGTDAMCQMSLTNSRPLATERATLEALPHQRCRERRCEHSRVSMTRLLSP